MLLANSDHSPATPDSSADPGSSYRYSVCSPSRLRFDSAPTDQGAHPSMGSHLSPDRFDSIQQGRQCLQCYVSDLRLLACLRTSFRSIASSRRRDFLNRLWRSAFVLLFSSFDLAGRPARSDSGRSTDGVKIFRLLNANGVLASASVRNFRLSPPSSKIGSAAIRLGRKDHSGARMPIFPAKCSAYAASHASATFPSGNLSFMSEGSSAMVSIA